MFKEGQTHEREKKEPTRQELVNNNSKGITYVCGIK